jgi:hypothetical protein
MILAATARELALGACVEGEMSVRLSVLMEIHLKWELLTGLQDWQKDIQ